MTRLSNLYQAIETLRKEGLEINEDLEKQVSELEEEIIKKEILPVITETIAPALKPVKRELVLVVDYIPDAPLSVHISRKRNIAAITDAKEITPDSLMEHTTKTHHMSGEPNAPATRLKITYNEGYIIQEKKAAKTFCQFVLKTGIDKVRALNLTWCKVPLVSNTLDDKYSGSQIPLGDGWYLMCHSNTQTKFNQIERIINALNIPAKVEIV